MSAGYAIFRVEKLKTKGNIAGSFDHITRGRPTPNADTSRTNQNRVLIGSRDKPILEAWQEEIDRCKINVRANAVHAVEVVITASPEYFRPDNPKAAGTWNNERLEQWVEAQQKFIAENFPHAIYAELQLDESTPHIQIIDLPILEKTTKDGSPKFSLDCRGKYGGEDRRTGLANWQDKAHEAVKHLGLDRGLPGSKATHKKISTWYGTIDEVEPLPPLEKLPKPLPEPSIKEQIPFTDAYETRKQKEAKQAKEAERVRRKNAKIKSKAVEMHNELAATASQAILAERRADEATQTAKALSKDLKKAKANEMRELPLNQVLTKLYGATLQADSKEHHASKKYNAEGREVVLTEKDGKQLFYFQDEARGGKGAIDLVMGLSGVDFNTAVQMLCDCFDSDAVARAVASKQFTKIKEQVEDLKGSKIALPMHDPQQEGAVKTYLSSIRKIPTALVDALIKAKKLIADHLGNAVFPRERGGYFKRGTRGKYHQTVGGKSCGAYVLGGKSDRVIFTESPIDALSLKAVHPQDSVIALGGNLLTAADMHTHAKDKQIVLAFDNDTQGKAFTQSFKKYFIHNVEVLKLPADCKDFNEALQKGIIEPIGALRRAEPSNPPANDQRPYKAPKNRI